MTTKLKPGTLAISGPVQLTTDSTYVWFKLPRTGWDFRSNDAREKEIAGHAATLAALNVAALHYRVTFAPRSAASWGRAHDEIAVEPLAGWGRHLRRSQIGLAGQLIDEKSCYLGVHLRDARGFIESLLPQKVGIVKRLERAAPRVEQITKALNGIGARPASACEIAALIESSVALGLPKESPWAVDEDEIDGSDVAAAYGAATLTTTPFGRTVAVTGSDDEGAAITTYAHVLAYGRMAPMEIPEHRPPWLQRLDALGVPHEVSMRVEIEQPEKTLKKVRAQLGKINGQLAHFAEHDQDPPAVMQEQRELGLSIEKEMTDALSGAGVRCQAWVHVATFGATPAEARSAGETIREAYKHQIELHTVLDQAAAVRAFTPGEPRPAKLHTRRMSLIALAAAVPWATSVWGDSCGIHLGRTDGTSSAPAFLDLWAAPENGQSGLACVAAGLGGGKSTLMGWILYNAAMQGIPAEVLDPSGRLQQLATLPELADHVRTVDLLDGDDGQLSPYGVVKDPSGRHFTGDDLERRREKTRRDRKTLALATLEQLLPTSMKNNGLTPVALMRAVGEVEPESNASLNEVLGYLGSGFDRESDPELALHAKRLRDILSQIATTDIGRLLFPASPAQDDDWQGITVYSLRGLNLPDDAASSVENDQSDARLALCVLSSASWLTTHRMYWGAHDQRKLIVIDEARMLRRTATGRALLESASADSRKHDTVVLIADQKPAELEALGLANLSDMAFMGKLTDKRQQAAACKLLKLPTDEGYEEVFGNIGVSDTQPRNFIARDWQGNIERLCNDFSYAQDVLTALNSTSDSKRLKKRVTPPNSARVKVVSA